MDGAWRRPSVQSSKRHLHVPPPTVPGDRAQQQLASTLGPPRKPSASALEDAKALREEMQRVVDKQTELNGIRRQLRKWQGQAALTSESEATEHVPLAEDVKDWHKKLTGAERNLLTQIFRFVELHRTASPIYQIVG